MHWSSLSAKSSGVQITETMTWRQRYICLKKKCSSFWWCTPVDELRSERLSSSQDMGRACLLLIITLTLKLLLWSWKLQYIAFFFFFLHNHSPSHNHALAIKPHSDCKKCLFQKISTGQTPGQVNPSTNRWTRWFQHSIHPTTKFKYLCEEVGAQQQKWLLSF